MTETRGQVPVLGCPSPPRSLLQMALGMSRGVGVNLLQRDKGKESVVRRRPLQGRRCVGLELCTALED